MNKIISITGPSGVGKSTISKIISICLGYENCCILSGDDSHLWERGDENWKFFTHLNPKANNLQQEYEHLRDLKNNKAVRRKEYNHKNGKFTKEREFFPNKFIVYEGLHAMYGKSSELVDISFYIEVEKSLKNEWKISRDSKKRGYTIDEIVKSIENRKPDETKYILPQKNKCDVIIKFKRSKCGKVSISFDYRDAELAELINKIKSLYQLIEDFVFVSHKVSQNPYLTQNKGGNMSFKFGESIAITESGSSFSEINYFQGFGFYKLSQESVFEGQRNPSMEIGCHLKLGTCVLHTHPLHVMAILCSEECDSILNELFDDYSVVEYYSPGKSISKNIKNHRNLFLKNHGIFISRGSLVECYRDTLEIESKCKEYLESKIKEKKFLFPDAYVLEQENKLYHSYVIDTMKSSGLSPKYLNADDLNVLKNMEEEKYRKNR